jgi:hypothetical protein
LKFNCIPGPPTRPAHERKFAMITKVRSDEIPTTVIRSGMFHWLVNPYLRAF